jgi:hypothetical protein
MTGYSGTPLAKKLGVKAGCRMVVIDPPANYDELLAPLPDDVRRSHRIDARANLVHAFVTRRVQLQKLLTKAVAKASVDAAIWVSWPKKSANAATDMTEDVVREVALPLGLVDIKVCAVDEYWSGLKLVIRKALRPKKK